jgi:hypothetical protein
LNYLLKSSTSYLVLIVSKLILKRGGNKQLAPNFNEREFFCKHANGPAEHPFYTQLIDAAQYLRSQFGAWRITSTYRTPEHEYSVCKEQLGMDEKEALALSQSSQHITGHAFDSQPINDQDAIKALLADDFLRRGKHFKALRLLGITGFGVYDWGVHLDCRTQPGKQRDSFGTFAFWDNRTNVKKKGLTTTLTRIQTLQHKAALAG